MIKEIFVKNFILINELHLDFYSHYSCFSGETGAGKSLLIDAISILCGARTSLQYIQKGCNKACIEAHIEVTNNHPVIQIIEEAGYELEDNTFILSRAFTLDGKSVTRFNQRTTTLSFVKEVMSQLIDIHSQHDNQYLLNNKFHLSLLDEYVNEPILLKKVNDAYGSLRNEEKALQHLLEEEMNQDDLDYLRFQLDEMESLDLKENEIETLEARQKEMASFDKDSSKINAAIAAVEASRYEQLYNIHKSLETLDNEIVQKASEELTNAYYLIDEHLQNLKDYRDNMQFDENEFNTIQTRLFAIQKILRKHGGSYSSFINRKVEMQERLQASENRSEYITNLEKRIHVAREEFHVVAQQLREVRQHKAILLQQEIKNELLDLHLENAQFQVDFQDTENKKGIDQIEFLVSMNAGESLKPLAKVASGGELSRLMLGLKTIFNRLAKIDTIIFDEIDNGVSGAVAYAIGKKMHTIAKQSQVFAVTHLAPVAVWANHHYYVEKTQMDNNTNSTIRHLDKNETIRELSMIAQGNVSQPALLAAEELYERANAEK